MTIENKEFMDVYHLLSQTLSLSSDQDITTQESNTENLEKNQTIQQNNVNPDQQERFYLPYRSWTNTEDIILVGIILEYYIIHGKQCKWSHIHELYIKTLEEYKKASEHSVFVLSLPTRTLLSLKKHYHYLRRNLKQSEQKKQYWNELYQVWKSEEYNKNFKLCDFKD